MEPEDFKALSYATTKLSDAIMAIAAKPPTKPTILDRELSGNKINGGVITNFSSAGIRDNARSNTLLIEDNTITVKNAKIDVIPQSLHIKGALNVGGEITAQKLHVNELSADVRQERSTPLVFQAEDGKIGGKGLLWAGEGSTKQFIYKGNPGGLWSSEHLELNRDKEFKIDGLTVLGFNYLGDTVTRSSLQTVGVLQNLQTAGDCNLDNFVFYNSSLSRLGIGSETPAGTLTVGGLTSTFIVDEDTNDKIKIGTFSASALDIITDNVARITISNAGTITLKKKVVVDGSLGVNITNFTTDVDISTSGPIRIQNKKFDIGVKIPNAGMHNTGDIIWNSNPAPTGYVGWICVKGGSPGEWRAFGQIQQ